jgi:O-glycosyl hydrolase
MASVATRWWSAVGMIVAWTGGVSAGEVSVWRSTSKPEVFMKQETSARWEAKGQSADARIEIQPDKTHQTILGMGSSLEPTTCFNIAALAEADQQEVIDKMVDPEQGIGMNLMRICMGTPDFTGDDWYSYDDVPAGEADLELARFSIEKDRGYILPVIRRVAKSRRDVLFFASPWSPPGWMKTTGTMIGGRLKPEWYAAYAQYFVKFIRAYEAEGVPIHAVTVQNEPGVDRAREKDPKWFYPSCRWSGEEEATFIREHLGPALRMAGLSTKIWCYDHNYNVKPTPEGDDPGLDYPRTILTDARARGFVAGVAFHGYAGQPTGMSLFQTEFPETPIHFTEGSVFGLLGAAKLVSILRNHAVSYNAWVTMSDTAGKPNNGPFQADTTAIQRDLESNRPKYNFDYFLMGHFMKFLPRGSVRVESDSPQRISHVVFRAPDGSMRLVMVNAAARSRMVTVAVNEEVCQLALPGSSIVTALWMP